MKHADCIGLLQINAERSGIHREAIGRLERYRALLERAAGFLETPAATWDDANALLRQIEEAIK